MSISEESLKPQFVGTAERTLQRPSPLIDLAVFLAAILGHLPAFGAWWNRDDWAFLAQSAGLVEPAGGFPARFFSQLVYWDLTWPLLGTRTDGHAALRLLIFALCAVLVTRIAARAGLQKFPRLAAGLIVAASPLAFTPLYWASGIQELLATFFALAAVERWLGGSRKNMLMAVALALLSIFSKESGLGLGLLFLVMLFVGIGPRREDRAFAWAMCFILLILSVIEGTLLMQQFPTGPGETMAMGGLSQIAVNLGTMGWWMLSPGPLLARDLLWPQTAAGAMLFLLWASWAWTRFRRRDHLPLLTLVAALLSIAAALPLVNQLQPFFGLTAVCAGSLALASLLPTRWKVSPLILVGLSLLAAVWGYFSFETRLNLRDEEGLPADLLVRSTSLSWQMCRMLPQLPLQRDKDQSKAITILQIPTSAFQIEMADKLGERWVTSSALHDALGGNLGPRLVLGNETRVDWVNALFTNPPEALVLCENGTDFKHWGNTGNAALYAALTDIGMGNFARARKHMVRGAGMNDETMSFAYDPSQMIIPQDAVLARKEEFIDWTVSLLGPDHSTREVGGMQDLFFNLLSVCTGQSVEELSQGSTLLIKEKKLEKDEGAMAPRENQSE